MTGDERVATRWPVGRFRPVDEERLELGAGQIQRRQVFRQQPPQPGEMHGSALGRANLGHMAADVKPAGVAGDGERGRAAESAADDVREHARRVSRQPQPSLPQRAAAHGGGICADAPGEGGVADAGGEDVGVGTQRASLHPHLFDARRAER